MEKVAFESSKNSMQIEEMKIVAHGADGFLLFPSRTKFSQVGELQALHTHLYYEFFFVLDEPLAIVTEEGATSFQNSVLIVPPRLKHFTCAEGKGGYRITVTASEVGRIGGECGLLDFVKKDCVTALTMSEEITYYLEKLLSADFLSAYGRAKGEALVKLIFLEIGTLLKSGAGARSSVSLNNRYRNMEKIDCFIGANYNRAGVCISMLASELCLSVRQVARIIKKEYGRTFVQMLNDKKMSVAAVLLEKTALSVSEIINELDFETENYFFRMFKKYYGVTPLQYREAQNK